MAMTRQQQKAMFAKQIRLTRTQLTRKTSRFVPGSEIISIDTKITTGAGKKVDAILSGQRGGDLFNAAIRTRAGFKDIDSMRSNLPKKFFPFTSDKPTPFIDVTVTKKKK